MAGPWASACTTPSLCASSACDCGRSARPWHGSPRCRMAFRSITPRHPIVVDATHLFADDADTGGTHYAWNMTITATNAARPSRRPLRRVGLSPQCPRTAATACTGPRLAVSASRRRVGRTPAIRRRYATCASDPLGNRAGSRPSSRAPTGQRIDWAVPTLCSARRATVGEANVEAPVNGGGASRCCWLRARCGRRPVSRCSASHAPRRLG